VKRVFKVSSFRAGFPPPEIECWTLDDLSWSGGVLRADQDEPYGVMSSCGHKTQAGLAFSRKLFAKRCIDGFIEKHKA